MFHQQWLAGLDLHQQCHMALWQRFTSSCVYNSATYQYLSPSLGFRQVFNRLAADIVCLTLSYLQVIACRTYHLESNQAPFTPVLDERERFELPFWCG